MKFTLLLFVFLFSSMQLIAQPKQYVSVKSVVLARTDIDGNIEEDVYKFRPTDIPIICYVELDSDIPTVVSLKFIAEKVKGVRPNRTVITSKYKTKKGETGVTFKGKPEKLWVVGKYRVEIYVNNKLAKSKTFIVRRPVDASVAP